MSFWDWKSGHRFQALDTTAQPGSLDAEAGLMSSTFDKTGLRLICGEADKTSTLPAPEPQICSLLTVLQSKYGNKTNQQLQRPILWNGSQHWADKSFSVMILEVAWHALHGERRMGSFKNDIV